MIWDKIFKAGTHTDNGGKTRTWTEADLDRMVATYEPAKQEAPLVLGHPKSDAPAFGWVDKLKRVGGDLYAAYKQVPEALADAVAGGRYKYKSIAVYPDGRLRHVGLLGAVPPAIKGLGPVAFEDGDVFCEITFKEDAMEIEELKKKLEAEETARKKADADAAAFAEKAKSAEDAQKKAEADKAAMEARFAESDAKAQRVAREARFDALVKEGKALPAEKTRALAFAEGLAEGEEIAFAEGEGKKPLEEHFWAFLADRGQHGLFEEYHAQDDDKGDKTPADLTARV